MKLHTKKKTNKLTFTNEEQNKITNDKKKNKV